MCQRDMLNARVSGAWTVGVEQSLSLFVVLQGLFLSFTILNVQLDIHCPPWLVSRIFLIRYVL